MKRIVNLSAGPRGLKQGKVSLRLPVGGFAEVDDEAWNILKKNKIIQAFVEKRLISVSEGPLNQEIQLKAKTTEKEMPAHYKPKAEDATFGSSRPVETKVESVQVKAKETKGKGERVSVKKVEK